MLSKDEILKAREKNSTYEEMVREIDRAILKDIKRYNWDVKFKKTCTDKEIMESVIKSYKERGIKVEIPESTYLVKTKYEKLAFIEEFVEDVSSRALSCIPANSYLETGHRFAHVSIEDNRTLREKAKDAGIDIDRCKDQTAQFDIMVGGWSEENEDYI